MLDTRPQQRNEACTHSRAWMSEGARAPGRKNTASNDRRMICHNTDNIKTSEWEVLGALRERGRERASVDSNESARLAWDRPTAWTCKVEGFVCGRLGSRNSTRTNQFLNKKNTINMLD